MNQSEHCRAMAEADQKQAAASELPHIRDKYLASAAVWLARAEMFERAQKRTAEAA